MEHKVFQHCEIKSADDTNLILEHFISTVTEDSGGDVMEPKGMVVRGKPVVLFQHGMDPVKGMEPIAKPVGISVGRNSKGVEGIIARTQFFPDEQGRRLYQKAKEGYMPNWSIGFEIDEYTPTTKGRRVTKWKLMEYSQVAVGMNEEAACEDVKLYAGIKLQPCEKCTGCKKCHEAKEIKPNPDSYDNEADFMHACVPMLMDEGKDNEQAVAACMSMWKEKKTPPPPAKELRTFAKSIAEQLVGQIPMQALYTIHNAMIGELVTRCQNTQDEGAKIASDILTEYIDLALPHMAAFVAECRGAELKGKTFDEIKTLLIKPPEQKQPVVPAPPVEPAPAKEVTPPEKTVTIMVTPKYTIPLTDEAFRSLAAETFKDVLATELTKFVRKSTGKLD